MSAIFEDKNRLVLPRCLEYITACSIGLLRVIRKEEVPITGVKDSNTRKEWIDNRTITTAVDLVAEALIAKDFEFGEAIEAAKYILDGAEPSNILIRQLANHFLAEPLSYGIETSNMLPVDARYVYISKLKKRVRMNPVNPIAWSDLALSYETLKQDEKAHKAMSTALGLSNNNRFILRAASRCFMHMDEPDRAVAILRRSGLCEFDPWIASAEIAISERFELTSKYISKSKYMIDDDNLTNFARSELTSGMATIEVKSGSLKKAKKLMNKALIDPTENALAQVEWLSNQINKDINEMNNLRRQVPASYEAQALSLYYDKKYKESLEASKIWSRYLYLSSRPIIHSSHIAALPMNDDKEAIRIFESCTPAQQDDPIAMNNYAFSLARSGEKERALEIIKKAKSYTLNERQKFVITATEGLIAYRSDNIEKGRLLYSIAVNGFERIHDPGNAIVATYFQAVEEKIIESQNAEAKIREAKKGIERYKIFVLEDLAKKL